MSGVTGWEKTCNEILLSHKNNHAETRNRVGPRGRGGYDVWKEKTGGFGFNLRQKRINEPREEDLRESGTSGTFSGDYFKLEQKLVQRVVLEVEKEVAH